MDKLRILKELERSAAWDIMNTDEIRLYFLLLANSKGAGEEIGFGNIRDALGNGFTPEKLRETCRKLERYGLIEVASSLKDVNDEDFRLAYHILEIKGGKQT